MFKANQSTRPYSSEGVFLYIKTTQKQPKQLSPVTVVTTKSRVVVPAT